MNVAAILRQKGRAVTTASPGATLQEVARKLAAKRIGAIVVVSSGGEVAGIISERDIVRALAEHKAKALKQPVGDFMTRKVATCTLDDTLADLMQQMTEGRFRHVPVIEHGRLAGIVSIGDVVKSRVAEIERESEALRDYIRTA